MNYAKYGLLVLTLAAVVGFTAPPAAAQAAFSGHFTLESEAYWGQVHLAPGEYTLLVNLDPTSLVRSVKITGEHVRTTILTGASMSAPASDRSKLELEQINGVNVIRQLDAGLVGQTFRFPVSKNALRNIEQASTSSPKTMTVPVSTSAY